jgi:hypothetical protein
MQGSFHTFAKLCERYFAFRTAFIGWFGSSDHLANDLEETAAAATAAAAEQQ